MSAALINDIFAWILLAFTIAFFKNKNMALASGGLKTEISAIDEVVTWALLVLVIVLACAGKLEDFVSGLLLTLFFSISGLKTEISAIDEVGTWALLVLVIVLACAGKIAGTVLVILYYIILIHEGVILGILMNAKGLIEMIVINIGKDQKQTVDGGMEITNPNFRMINQIVLANAPCYVGILVDRGLSGSTRLAANQVTHHVVVLFFGGPNDREALSYGLRMREHPGINLTVIKLLLGEAALEDRRSDSRKSSMNNDSRLYQVVNHGEETIAAIRTIDHAHDLFIVGRGQGTISPLTTGLIDWNECPELGAKGDLLASSDHASVVSLLVVQQYVGMGQGDHLLTPDSPGQQLHDHFNFSYHQTQIKTMRSAAEFTSNTIINMATITVI
ncbi:hypothetical protein P3S67_007083 [Capsicum chacoense]